MVYGTPIAPSQDLTKLQYLLGQLILPLGRQVLTQPRLVHWDSLQVPLPPGRAGGVGRVGCGWPTKTRNFIFVGRIKFHPVYITLNLPKNHPNEKFELHCLSVFPLVLSENFRMQTQALKSFSSHFSPNIPPPKTTTTLRFHVLRFLGCRGDLRIFPVLVEISLAFAHIDEGFNLEVVRISFTVQNHGCCGAQTFMAWRFNKNRCVQGKKQKGFICIYYIWLSEAIDINVLFWLKSVLRSLGFQHIHSFLCGRQVLRNGSGHVKWAIWLSCIAV